MLADSLPRLRRLAPPVVEAVRPGAGSGRFRRDSDPDQIAVLAIALVDGIGVPLALGDPQITIAAAIDDMLSVLDRATAALAGPDGGRAAEARAATA